MNLYLLSVLILAAYTMAMPAKTTLSSEEEYGSVRGNSLHDRYPMFVIAPVRSDDHQRHSLDALRGLNDNELLSFLYAKRLVDKRSLDSIGGGHLI